MAFRTASLAFRTLAGLFSITRSTNTAPSMVLSSSQTFSGMPACSWERP